MSQRVSSFSVLLALLLGALLACGREESSPESAASPNEARPADPDAIAVVSGQVVRQADLDAAVQFFREARPELGTDAMRIATALNEDLFLVAAAQARRPDRHPAVRRRITEALRSLEAGAVFHEVAARFSEAASKGNWGKEGWRYRSEFRNSSIGRALFETPKGKYSPPVASILGLHIVYVEDEIRLGPPDQHKVRYAQILAKFDELESAEEILRATREAVDVTWLHPDYVRYVDPVFLPVVR